MKLFALFLLVIGFSLVGLAEHPNYSPILKQGSHHGKSIDLNKWRYASVLPEKTNEELRRFTFPFEKNGLTYSTFGNLKHKGAWFVAAYPNVALKVSVIVEHFAAPVPAAHSFVWVQFPSYAPLVAMPQDGRGEPELLYDLFVSSEAARPKDVKYDILRGSQVYSDFVLVHGFYSLDEMKTSRGKDASKTIDEFPVSLTHNQKANVIPNAVHMSRRDGYQRVYDTLSVANCQGASLEMIDRSVGRYSTLSQARMRANPLAEIYPNMAGKALKARGLFSKKLNFFDSLRIRSGN